MSGFRPAQGFFRSFSGLKLERHFFHFYEVKARRRSQLRIQWILSYPIQQLFVEDSIICIEIQIG